MDHPGFRGAFWPNFLLSLGNVLAACCSIANFDPVYASRLLGYKFTDRARRPSSCDSAHIAESLFFPVVPALSQDRFKMTLKNRTGTLEIPLGVGFGGGEARKRFVEQGDDSLLFGEWGEGEFEFC